MKTKLARALSGCMTSVSPTALVRVLLVQTSKSLLLRFGLHDTLSLFLSSHTKCSSSRSYGVIPTARKGKAQWSHSGLFPPHHMRQLVTSGGSTRHNRVSSSFPNRASYKDERAEICEREPAS